MHGLDLKQLVWKWGLRNNRMYQLLLLLLVNHHGCYYYKRAKNKGMTHGNYHFGLSGVIGKGRSTYTIGFG